MTLQGRCDGYGTGRSHVTPVRSLWRGPTTANLRRFMPDITLWNSVKYQAFRSMTHISDILIGTQPVRDTGTLA